MYSLMTDMHRIFSNINDVGAIRRIKFVQCQAKYFVKVICSAILLLNSSLAEAESKTAKLSVSARVIRSCGVSAGPLAVRNSDSQASREFTEIGTGLKIDCNTGSAGAIDLSLDTGMTGNSVIRVISNDNGSAETLKEAYLTDEGKNFGVKHINLGLFPVAGPKVIFIQRDNPIGGPLTTDANERTITIFINF